MSMTIFGIQAVCRISPDDLKRLVLSSRVSRDGKTYNGKKLYDILTAEYGWSRPDPEADCVCLSRREESEIVPDIPLPDGKRGSMYLCWPEATEAEPSVFLIYRNEDFDKSDDGLHITGFYCRDGRLHIEYENLEDTWSLHGDDPSSGSTEGFQDTVDGTGAPLPAVPETEWRYISGITGYARSCGIHFRRVECTKRVAVPVDIF